MYRVITPNHIDSMFFVQKKFLFWWLDYPAERSCGCLGAVGVVHMINHGRYSFTKTNLHNLNDPKNLEKSKVGYYKNASDFIERNVELFI